MDSLVKNENGCEWLKDNMISERLINLSLLFVLRKRERKKNE